MAATSGRGFAVPPPPVPGPLYPILIDGVGCCPPEDVGGPCGYSDFIDTVADPNHERHDELTDWIGGTFDPLAPNIDERAKAVDALA